MDDAGRTPECGECGAGMGGAGGARDAGEMVRMDGTGEVGETVWTEYGIGAD